MSREHVANVAVELKTTERAALRLKIAVGVVALIVLLFASLCVNPSLGGGFLNPLDVLDGIAAHVTALLSSVAGGSTSADRYAVMAQHPCYYQVETRAASVLVALVCGVMLSVAGSLFQMVFRNPIAAPTMLGVSNGMQLGLMVFVLQFGAAALNLPLQRYLYAFAGCAVVLLLVLGLTKAVCGKGRAFSVFELLMVGSIFSQICGGVVQAITSSGMSDELWEIYQTVAEPSNFALDGPALAVVLVAALITVVPVFLMRFSINAVGFTGLEARLMGLNPGRLKIVCLVAGTLMVAVAQLNLGTIAMLSLVVPFVSRAVFGTEFKHQFWGDVLIGAFVLLLCSDLVVLFPVFHMELTLSVVVNFVMMPFYVWIVAARQKGWQ